MMRRLYITRPQILYVGLLLLFALVPLQAAAQDTYEGSNQFARKFDEFGRVGGCDYGARLDNFAIQLQNEPNADGYIISYGPEGVGSGTGKFAMKVAKDYLVDTRSLEQERIKTIYAGRYKEWNEVATELWIAPHDAPAPEPVSYRTEVNDFTGKFTEYDAWDFMGEGDGGTGPTHGNVLSASFADILHQKSDRRAYIVAYNTTDGAPRAWRRVAKQISDDLQQEYKLEADRITIIYGGLREATKNKDAEGIGPGAPAFVQLWILPKDAPPPVAEVKEPEQRPSKAVRMNTSSSYLLSYEDEAQKLFEGFADVLRSDERLSACLIVRLESKVEGNAKDDATENPAAMPVETDAADSLPKADLMAVVEKWKSDLVEKYGISEHRLMVITAKADKWSGGELETWLVPLGAALPDPNAREEIIAGGEATEFVEETQ